jgi:hypothetical protein
LLLHRFQLARQLLRALELLVAQLRDRGLGLCQEGGSQLVADLRGDYHFFLGDVEVLLVNDNVPDVGHVLGQALDGEAAGNLPLEAVILAGGVD